MHRKSLLKKQKFFTLKLLVAIASCCFFSSCGNLLPDLQRDNLLDIKNEKNALQCSKSIVVYDTYGDMAANSGETVFMEIYLKNNSKKIAHFITGKFSTESPYVSNLMPKMEINFWSGKGLNFIDPGKEAYGAYKDAANNAIYSMKFDLSPNTPESAEILFNIDIKDIYDHHWNSYFIVKVKKVNTDVHFYNYQVVYDNNHDGIINKGETVYLKTFLINSGQVTTKKIQAVISSTNPFITNLTPDTVSYLTMNLSNVALYGMQVFGYFNSAPNDSVYSVKFDVSGNAPSGSEILFRIDIKDIFNNTRTDTFKIVVH